MKGFLEKIKENKKLIFGIVGVIVVVVLLVVLIVMLGGKKTVCTMKSDQSKNGYVLETKYEISSKNNKVNTVKITETITSKEGKTLDKFAKQLKEQYSFNKKTYGGYTYKVDTKDDKVVSNVTIDYNKFDMKKFVKNNEAMKKYTKNNNFTLDGAIELYESTGATCK